MAFLFWSFFHSSFFLCSILTFDMDLINVRNPVIFGLLSSMLHGYKYGTYTGYEVRKSCKNWGAGTSIYIYLKI